MAASAAEFAFDSLFRFPQLKLNFGGAQTRQHAVTAGMRADAHPCSKHLPAIFPSNEIDRDGNAKLVGKLLDAGANVVDGNEECTGDLPFGKNRESIGGAIFEAIVEAEGEVTAINRITGKKERNRVIEADEIAGETAKQRLRRRETESEASLALIPALAPRIYRRQVKARLEEG